jgi:hypothetical protein
VGQGQHRGSRDCLKPPRKTQQNRSKEITSSASAEKCPHGDGGWGEFVAAADPTALVCGKGARQIGPPHPSHPIMRRPDADLEEKQEPRVTGELQHKPEANLKKQDLQAV